MSDLEFVLKFETGISDVADEAKKTFGEDDVTISSRMTGGGLEVAAFIKATLDAIKSALSFLGRNQGKAKNASIMVGSKTIKLEGYGADDAVKVLEAIQNLREIEKP